MGYISQIAIECDKDTYDAVMTYISTLSFDFTPNRHGRIPDPWMDQYGMYWSFVKWLGYEETCDDLVDIWKILEDHNCYHFLGLGEDGYVEEKTGVHFNAEGRECHFGLGIVYDTTFEKGTEELMPR